MRPIRRVWFREPNPGGATLSQIGTGSNDLAGLFQPGAALRVAEFRRLCRQRLEAGQLAACLAIKIFKCAGAATLARDQRQAGVVGFAAEPVPEPVLPQKEIGQTSHIIDESTQTLSSWPGAQLACASLAR